MMLMTMTDVLLRKFTNYSILGTVELTELMMVIVIFCSLAQCEVNDGHIKVDLVFKRFRPRMRLVVDTITQFLCFALFSLMAWAMYRHAVNVKEWGEITFDLGFPLYPFVYVASFGCLLLALVLLFKTLVVLHKVFTT
jgi:TRAP-type C4-dicarboxylate transport system permease small subunit